jgi:PAS domain S-box-containing protein
MPITKPSESETLIRLDKKIEGLEQQARDLACSVETVRQQTLLKSNEKIEALEQKARDLACFVETTRQQTLLQSDNKTDALEQKARDLADFVETLRNQTRLQSETEIEALGQKARDLALFVETVRKETRMQSQAEIAALGQKARDLAVAVETVREDTLLQSDTQIAALGQQARDLAVSVETVRGEALLHSETEIAAMGNRARILARSVETVRQQTLALSNEKIEALTLGSAEQALDLRNILDSSTEYSIVGKDLNGKILLWNEGARRLYGYESEEVVGMANASLLHTPEDVASGEDRKIRESALHDGKWEGILTRVRKNGQRFTARVVITLRRDAQARAVGFLLISKDITDEVRLTEDLKNRTAQLEAANNELEAFSYSVSHDLRSPLRSIQGFSRILLEEHAQQLSAEVQEYLQDIRRNSVRMGHLVDDLLTFSRLSRQDLQTREVSPVQVITQVLDELRAEREGRDVEIDIGELPFCQADPALLKQVWINLLANALKYSRKKEAARIEVGCRQDGEERVYFVRDNGIGFDMRYAGKLFGVFQRMHTATEYEGTGVGLAIVQRIIHRHGGRIWAEATVNQGATFSFTIPSSATHTVPNPSTGFKTLKGNDDGDQ